MRLDIKDALDRYAKDGCPVGGFLTAVLSNDLRDAFGRADEDNQRDMLDICSYVYNHIPESCHGSRKIVKEWIATKQKEEELRNEPANNRQNIERRLG